jgi:hypothetical protein
MVELAVVKFSRFNLWQVTLDLKMFNGDVADNKF